MVPSNNLAASLGGSPEALHNDTPVALLFSSLLDQKGSSLILKTTYLANLLWPQDIL
jgi:hypothetical protein